MLVCEAPELFVGYGRSSMKISQNSGEEPGLGFEKRKCGAERVVWKAKQLGHGACV